MRPSGLRALFEDLAISAPLGRQSPAVRVGGGAVPSTSHQQHLPSGYCLLALAQAGEKEALLILGHIQGQADLLVGRVGLPLGWGVGVWEAVYHTNKEFETNNSLYHTKCLAKRIRRLTAIGKEPTAGYGSAMAMGTRTADAGSAAALTGGAQRTGIPATQGLCARAFGAAVSRCMPMTLGSWCPCKRER